MKIRIFVLFWASLLSLSGCALTGHQGVRPEEYSATQKSFDVTFGWNRTLTADGMTIEGYARNNRFFVITGLELRVSLIAADGKEKAKDTFLFIPRELRLGDTAPFTILLNARPQAGDMLRYTYSFRYSDGGDGDNEVWMNSFEVKALE